VIFIIVASLIAEFQPMALCSGILRHQLYDDAL